MPSVSVIMPVYQAEKFLKAVGGERAGRRPFPTGNCCWWMMAAGIIPRQYATASPGQDDRIRVIHKQKNAGVSAARNSGLDEAQGEYIAFLDSDDGFEPQALETLWCLRERAGDRHGRLCPSESAGLTGPVMPEQVLPAGVYEPGGKSGRRSWLLCWESG